jgi:hypothetical protein
MVGKAESPLRADDSAQGRILLLRLLLQLLLLLLLLLLLQRSGALFVVPQQAVTHVEKI